VRGALLGLLTVLGVLGGCSVTVPGTPNAGTGAVRGEVDTSFVHGAGRTPVDQVAAAVLLDVQEYWRRSFPETFGTPWQELRGGFHSVDTTEPDTTPPPCADSATEVEGNAYYCSRADAIVWDRAALLPVLRERFGDVAVVVVLAHEVGHAVHHRAGIGAAERLEQPERYPTILTEAMADCYAGSFLRWVVDGHAGHLDVTPGELDAALDAMITFRDPLGTDRTDREAHGNAFDRVSAFQDGYQHGAGLCAGMTVDNRRFTLRDFTSLEDQASGGNMEFHRMVAAVSDDLNRYFTALVTRHGHTWRPPTLRETTGTPRCAGEQGPVAFCPTDGAVELDPSGDLPRLHRDTGDYATGTLLATRYGLAALAAMGRPVDGEEAGRAAVCLAGAYTGEVFQRQEGFGLSPGDLDEAIQVLLHHDYGSRGAPAGAVPSGFDRVALFRTGTLQGPQACGID